jgi:hypothetical protein
MNRCRYNRVGLFMYETEPPSDSGKFLTAGFVDNSADPSVLLPHTQRLYKILHAFTALVCHHLQPEEN